MTQARSRRIRTNMKSNEYEADEREKKKKNRFWKIVRIGGEIRLFIGKNFGNTKRHDYWLIMGHHVSPF